MFFIEFVLSYVLGLSLLCLTGWMLRLKRKVGLFLLGNSLFGFFCALAYGVFGSGVFSAMSAFLSGSLGVPGFFLALWLV